MDYEELYLKVYLFFAYFITTSNNIGKWLEKKLRQKDENMDKEASMINSWISKWSRNFYISASPTRLLHQVGLSINGSKSIHMTFLKESWTKKDILYSCTSLPHISSLKRVRLTMLKGAIDIKDKKKTMP